MKRLVFLLAFLLLPCVLGLNVEINVDDVSIGEELSFDYLVSSDGRVDVRLTPSISCDSYPSSFLGIESFTVGANAPYESSYSLGVVGGDMVSQKCVAKVKILSPEVMEFEKGFDVVSILPIQYRVLSCRDLSCESESRVFIKGEKVFFTDISDVISLDKRVSVVYPDGKIKDISFPFVLDVDEIGEYVVEYDVSKEGYMSVSGELKIGVIEENSNIGLLNNDIEIDKKAGVNRGTNESFGWFVLILFAVLIVALVLLYFLYRKVRK